jgi:two-component system, NtrC family, response regulator AtoC
MQATFESPTTKTWEKQMQTRKNGQTVLLAEDDPEVRSYMEMALRCQGYSVEMADDGEEALEMFEANPRVSAVLLDIVMPRRDGLETLREIRRMNPTVPIIMVSGASSPLNVVDAMRNGANDFLAKPVTHSDLQKVLSSAFAPKIPVVDVAVAPAPAAKNVFFGSNPQMRSIQALLPQIGWSEAPALILGETGVGKEVLARELHAQSPRAKKAFLKVNCAALPSELVESELFGYERGAFTGAFQKKPGMFELADGGTIFLDEIGDMDFKLQAKLLQVLQDSEFQRLGGKDTVRVDVRVIAATHKDLEKAMFEETFRSDLYYRLNVLNLRVPALRERSDDILGLADFLMNKHTQGQPVPPMTPTLAQALTQYDWPGNIRELENIVRKLLILRDPDLIIRELRTRVVRQRTMEHLQTGTNSSTGSKTILEQVNKAKNEAETAAIVAALESTHWNRKQAARLLKLDYKALLYKMKKLAIDDRIATLSHPPMAVSTGTTAVFAAKA